MCSDAAAPVVPLESRSAANVAVSVAAEQPRDRSAVLERSAFVDWAYRPQFSSNYVN
ncbi:hypothetical protein NJ7G_2698 [Natrinema sp. J7-2]|nr:hypothetical protein NJ7G_2698 [Natrinema sp. J7-2]